MSTHPTKIYHAALFDLDGTLIDSAPSIMDAMNTVLKNHNFPVFTLEEYHSKIGKGLFELVNMSVPENQRKTSLVEQYSHEMISVYERVWRKKTILFPNIAQVLRSLSEKHVYLAILSNKEEQFVKKIVESTLSEWRFQSVIGKSDTHIPKPDPTLVYKIVQKSGLPLSSWLFIGDSLIDSITAHRAGMDFFHAFWGYSTVELTTKTYTSLSPLDLLPFFE